MFVLQGKSQSVKKPYELEYILIINHHIAWPISTGYTHNIVYNMAKFDSDPGEINSGYYDLSQGNWG